MHVQEIILYVKDVTQRISYIKGGFKKSIRKEGVQKHGGRPNNSLNLLTWLLTSNKSVLSVSEQRDLFFELSSILIKPGVMCPLYLF